MTRRLPLSLLLSFVLACGSDGVGSEPVNETDGSVEPSLPSERDASAGLLDASREPAASPDASRSDAAPPDAGPRADAAVCQDCADAATAPTTCAGPVGAVPSALRQRLGLDAFYKKHLDAEGIPILSSAAPDDRSLVLACELIQGLLQKREDVRRALIERKARFVIIGKDEGTADVPEYGYRERTQAERDQINKRARGLGGQVASCGEENMLCLPGDRYRDESICLHEFAHTIATYGVYVADKTFEKRLTDAYTSASRSGILDQTYRKESVQEYWAEGVQDWYDSNASADPSNGIHNQVDTRPELKTFDPTLYKLVDEVFPGELAWSDCHQDK